MLGKHNFELFLYESGAHKSRKNEKKELSK